MTMVLSSPRAGARVICSTSWKGRCEMANVTWMLQVDDEFMEEVEFWAAMLNQSPDIFINESVLFAINHRAMLPEFKEKAIQHMTQQQRVGSKVIRRCDRQQEFREQER